MENFSASVVQRGPAADWAPPLSSARPRRQRRYAGYWLLLLLLLGSALTGRAANPVLLIQGTGNLSPDVTAFVDLVEIVRVSDGVVMSSAVANPSFETFAGLSNGNYGYTPTGAAWAFNSRSGIAVNGSNFGAPAAPSGGAVAFIQSTSGMPNGQIQQTLTLGTGMYRVRFLVAQRGCCSSNDQNLNVYIDGTLVGAIQPPNNNAYLQFTSNAFTVDPPAVSSFTPTRNFLAAALASNVVVNFSQPIANATASNIKVFSAQAGGKKAGAYSTSGSTVTFNPTTDFKAGETVFATIPATVASTGGATTTNKQVYQFTTAAGGTGRGNFLPGSTTAVTSISDVVAADFNGDGLLDLADNGSGLEVRFGSGGGSYGTATTYAAFAANSVRGLTAGDLDNDGNLDLVVANNTGPIGVLQNNGAGAFTALADAPSNGTSPRKPALGDLDGDGDLDMVVAMSNGTSAVGVYFNNGSGGFTAPTNVSIIGSASSANSTYVALGDLDNDGDLDFAVTDYNNARVVVRLNNGSGSFVPGSDVAVGANPNAVALADVNGDGALDMLTSNIGVAALSVSLNNNNGTGSFATSIAYPLPATSAGLAVGDVDADGDLDVVTGSNQNAFAGFYLVLNNGSGVFGTATNIAAADKMYYLALADLDNDGDLDLAGAAGNGGSLFVRLNQPPAPTITSFSPTPAGAGIPVTLTGTDLSGATALTINGAAATILTNTGTALTFRVPAGATATGTSSVTTPGGTTSSTAFAFLPPPGNALNFDGVNDEVRTAATAPAFGTGDFTLEAWVRTNSTSTDAVLALGSLGGNDYWLGMRNGYAAVSVSGTECLSATKTINDNRWHHLAGVRSSGTLTVYVDGVAVGSRANALGASPSAVLGIGSFGNGTFLWLGSLDEVRLWSVARTPAQLTAAMTTPLAGTETGLVRYYSFDEGTPAGTNTGLTALYDLTSNAAHGTLSNFALTGSTSNWVESYALVVPTATAATAVSNNTFTANWTAPGVGTVTSYVVDVSASSTFASAVSGSPFTVAAGTTSLAVGSLPGGTYYYRVRADKTSVTGQGAYSNVVSVVVPSATLSCAAAANNALSFDGSSDNVHTTSRLPATGEFTIETWVNPTTLPGSGGLTGLLMSDNFTSGAMHWQFNGNTLEFSVAGSNPTDLFSSFTVPTGTWSHLAVVYSAAAKTAKFYLNGALQNTSSYTTAVAVGAQPYSVGSWLSGSPQRFLNGALNELRVWSVARTDAQILASYNQALPAQAGLAILYSFDQGTAGGTNTGQTTLNDDSGNGHSGTLNTFALTGTTSNWVAGNTLAYTLGLSSFSPATGSVGGTVTLTGAGFTGVTAVRFNGTAASFTVVNGSTITAVIPAGATSGPLTVTGPCGTVTSAGSFTVCPAPVATAQNATVTLNASGNATLAATALNNGSTANCGPAAAGSLSASQTSFSCTDAVPATVASALSFNGSNQYVALPATTPVPTGNSAYTIEAWIKPTAMGTYGIIGWGNYGVTNQVNALRLSSTGLNNYWWANDLVLPTANLAGAWHHVAATFDGTTRTLYLDGAAIGSDTPGSGHAVPTAANLRIGSTNNGEFFPGSIDEVRVWSVARTAAQLGIAKGVGLPAGTTGLVAYYRLNEGTGLVANDATGSAASQGTLTNGPTWTTDAPAVTNGLPVTLTVTDNSGNTSTATAVVTVSVPPTPTTTWNGAASTSWTDCANWSYGKVPDATTSVVIPAGQPRYPVLTAGSPYPVLNLTVDAGGTLALNGGATLQVSGNLANNGTATLSGTVQFVGSTATQTLGGSTSTPFVALVVNKPSGTVQLGQALTINSALTLTSGTLTTTASYQVNLGGSATISESETSYVLGKVVVNRTLVPGTAEAFSGLGLTLTPAAGSTAPGATLLSRTTGTAINGAGTSQSILRFFDIQPAVNTGLNVTMSFTYFTHELNGIPVGNLALFKSVSGAAPWIPQRGTTAGANVVTKTGITDFSVWTLGNAANPLPVELTAFAATAHGRAVQLQWSTASEKNTRAFEVERSLSGSSFERIGTVAAAGSSAAPRTYELLDNQVPKSLSPQAPIYYRLKQVDQDGTFSYSPVRSVRLREAAEGLALFPNPTTARATLTGAQPGALVTVFDALGRLVLSAPADAAGTATLALPAGLPTGVYVVRAGTQALRLTVE